MSYSVDNIRNAKFVLKPNPVDIEVDYELDGGSYFDESFGNYLPCDTICGTGYVTVNSNVTGIIVIDSGNDDCVKLELEHNISDKIIDKEIKKLPDYDIKDGSAYVFDDINELEEAIINEYEQKDEVDLILFFLYDFEDLDLEKFLFKNTRKTNNYDINDLKKCINQEFWKCLNF